MIKTEENQQNLSFNFKLKLILKGKPPVKFQGIRETEMTERYGGISKGIYSQLKNKGNLVDYRTQKMDLSWIKQAFEDVLQHQKPDIKLHVNQAGLEAFNKALIEDQIKQIKKNEHRKGLSFQSKIFKQTYKFR